MMNNQQIAAAFSTGRFNDCYPYLANDVSWHVVGEHLLQGKDAVVQFCEKTAAYFASVSTDFKTANIIVDGDTIAIDGNANFITSENKTITVASCDVYRFEDGQLKAITSYCITGSR
jgi:ketosteroid isomerase-like protein